jgi:hypothetical protein
MEFTSEELQEIKNALDNWELEEGMYDFNPNLKVIRSIREKLGFKEDIEMMYDKDFGNDKICVCGHPYYRHFDTHHQMYNCGCKYCYCKMFKEKQ